MISYEEYHPYGTSAYRAGRSATEVKLKRYRYTGMKRDEESGLAYHTARYYLVWLGRWGSCDPIGIGDGVNVYGYVKGNPIILIDISGEQAAEKIIPDVIGYSLSLLKAVNDNVEVLNGVDKGIKIPEVIGAGVELTGQQQLWAGHY